MQGPSFRYAASLSGKRVEQNGDINFARIACRNYLSRITKFIMSSEIIWGQWLNGVIDLQAAMQIATADVWNIARKSCQYTYVSACLMELISIIVVPVHNFYLVASKARSLAISESKRLQIKSRSRSWNKQIQKQKLHFSVD